jgi:hypothetical protein
MQLADSLDDVANSLRKIGLRITARQFEMAARMLREHQSPLTALQVSQLLLDLGAAISSEMSENLFLRVFAERSDFYLAHSLFRRRVDSAFPSAGT